jgi:hypothetical protein
VAISSGQKREEMSKNEGKEQKMKRKARIGTVCFF